MPLTFFEILFPTLNFSSLGLLCILYFEKLRNMERCVCERVILWEVQGQGFTLYISEIDVFLPSKVRCACPGSDFRNIVDSIIFYLFFWLRMFN